MIDRVYLSPFPGRFYRPDGQLTSAAPPGQAPLMPTAADLADLFAGYNGDQILSGEANWGELGLAGADLAGIGTEVRGAIELATEVATLASGYGAIITLGVELLKWMSKGGGSGSGTDPLLAALQRIDARLKRIENEQVAEFKLSRKSTLELLQGRSGTAMWNAQEYMALGRPQDTFSLNKMAIANFESQASAQTLVQNIDGAFWQRPNNPLYLATNPTSYYDSWMPHMPDDRAPVSDGLTWDYRWALPAVLHIISARVTVLKALGDRSFDAGTAGGNEIMRYVKFIEQVRKRITAGLRALTYVRPEVLDMYPTMGRAPVAVGDIYTGRGLAAVVYTPHWTKDWFQPRLPWPVPSYRITASPRNAQELTTNVEVVESFWWSVLYASTGIPELERYEGELRGLVKKGWGSQIVPELQNPYRSVTAAAASSAKALIDMTATDDRASDARRAFRVYKALRDDSQARGRVGSFVDELLDLPSSRVEFDALRDVDDAAVEEELGAIPSPPQWPTEETSAQPLGERSDPGDEPVEEHAGVDVNADERVGFSSPAVTPVSDRHASR
jgi:hypothetical protein